MENNHWEDFGTQMGEKNQDGFHGSGNQNDQLDIVGTGQTSMLNSCELGIESSNVTGHE